MNKRWCFADVWYNSAMELKGYRKVSVRELELAVTPADLSLFETHIRRAASVVLGVTETATPGVKFDYGAKKQPDVFQVKVEKQGPGWCIPTTAYINPFTVAQMAKGYLKTNADKLAPVYEKFGLTREQILRKEMATSAILMGATAVTQMYYNLDSKGNVTEPEALETAIAIFNTALSFLRLE